ncbi:FadR/GntR family transcriptional regulator [Jiella sp. M17.18]|uniref:FadR/GntR family transcriptional regulator n=1 Tax=Jiella sp. M17.18 TaxID=3234247 RepID=UPI0034DE8607
MESGLLSGMADLPNGLARETASDRLCGKLAEFIASGVLHPGDQLPGERELAALFGVSRETVRMGVRTLAAHGLAEISHGSRTRIVSADVGLLVSSGVRTSAVNRYDVDDVHQARMVVELAVVADAAENIDAATLDVLAELLRRQDAVKGDAVQFLICDRDFHGTIYRAARNPILVDTTMALYGYMMGHRRRVMSQPEAVDQSYRDHRDIVDALSARDRAGVVEAFARHLARIHASTKQSLAAGEGAT